MDKSKEEVVYFELYLLSLLLNQSVNLHSENLIEKFRRKREEK